MNAHRVVLVCWFLLFATQMLWWAWLGAADLPVPRVVLIVLGAGPLLLPLRGLLYDRPRSYFWFNLLLLGYFAFAVAAVYASGGTVWVWWVQLAATLAGFTAGFVRTRGA